MTKKLLILTSIVFTVMFTYAQSLSLSHEGTALEPNEEITAYGQTGTTEIVVEIDVTNNSSDTIPVMVKKVENYLVENSENTFCWGLCFLPNTYVSPNPIEIAGGATNDLDFSGHYTPYDIPGESSISYVFFDEMNPNDSVMVTVIYSTLETGIGNNFKINYSLSQPYPNPVTGVVNFDYNLPNYQSASVKIYSLIGSLVGEVEINSATGTLKYDTGELEEGFYFYSLFTGNEKIESGKFVVKH